MCWGHCGVHGGKGTGTCTHTCTRHTRLVSLGARGRGGVTVLFL